MFHPHSTTRALTTNGLAVVIWPSDPSNLTRCTLLRLSLLPPMPSKIPGPHAIIQPGGHLEHSIMVMSVPVSVIPKRIIFLLFNSSVRVSLGLP